MDDRTDLHVRVSELEEALDDVRSEVERIRVEPTDDPKQIERRATTRTQKHRERVKALETKIRTTRKELYAVRAKVHDARAEIDGIVREPNVQGVGRVFGYALFGVGVLLLIATIYATAFR